MGEKRREAISKATRGRVLETRMGGGVCGGILEKGERIEGREAEGKVIQTATV